MLFNTDLILFNGLTLGTTAIFLLRIMLSAVCGVIVGLERSWRFKEAGVRTHCIIASSAAVLMILSKYAFMDLSSIEAFASKAPDPSRMAAQVISGISFLGAGVIFKNGGSVRGLTTAAGIWATSAIGLCFGAGMYIVGAFETIVILIIQYIMHKRPVGSEAYTIQRVSVTLDDTQEARDSFLDFLKQSNMQVIGSSIFKKEPDRVLFNLQLRIEKPILFEQAMLYMEDHAEVHEISV